MNHLQILFLTLFGFAAIKSNDSLQTFRSKRMIGGNSTEHAKFPYQVRINEVVGDFQSFFCGGSILDDYHVISAAHCFVDYMNSSFPWKHQSSNIIAGVTDLQKDNATQWITATVQKIYIPKIFIDNLKKNYTIPLGDIAILKLKTSLNLKKNSHIRAVDLPENTDLLYVNETAVVTGYGLNNVYFTYKIMINDREYQLPYGDSENKLHFGNTTVFSNSECRRRWDDQKPLKGWLKANVTESHICAQFNPRDPSGSGGACNGDSGSPLVYKGNIQIGVASYASDFCLEDVQPAVYTRISAYMDFITKVKNNKENNFEDPEILTTEAP